MKNFDQISEKSDARKLNVTWWINPMTINSIQLKGLIKYWLKGQVLICLSNELPWASKEHK